MNVNSPILKMDEKTSEIEDTMQKLRLVNSQALTALLADTYTWDKLCIMFGIVNDYITATHEGIKELRELTDAAVAEAAADTGGK